MYNAVPVFLEQIILTSYCSVFSVSKELQEAFLLSSLTDGQHDAQCYPMTFQVHHPCATKNCKPLPYSLCIVDKPGSAGVPVLFIGTSRNRDPGLDKTPAGSLELQKTSYPHSQRQLTNDRLSQECVSWGTIFHTQVFAMQCSSSEARPISGNYALPSVTHSLPSKSVYHV